jgi:Zn-dependent protease with chaperone function
MMLQLGLLGYAVLLAVAAPKALAGARWTGRAPWWGIAAWQALSGSLLLTVATVGVSSVLPLLHATGSLGELLRACAKALRAEYQVLGGEGVAAMSGTFALLILGRAVWCVGSELRRASRARADHRGALRLVGRSDPTLGAVVVEHGSRAAYCLPGRHGKVVISSAALASLDDDELQAVLAHERAHLSGRHHLVLGAASGLARAFPFVPLLAAARRECAVLVEMLADDKAGGQDQHLTVASALVALGSPVGSLLTGPSGFAVGLMATGTATAARVARLLDTDRPTSRVLGPVCGLALSIAVLTPLVMLAVPAAALANSEYCPV